MSDNSNKKAIERLIAAMMAQGPIYWGAQAIAERIGRTARQVYNLLDKERLKGAHKIGSIWVMTEGAIQKNFPDTETN